MKLVRLFDKNGTEIKEGDLIQFEDYNGIEDGRPNKVVSYGDKWYIETVPNEKGTLFLLTNFSTRNMKNDATNEEIIMLKTYKKIEKGEQK